MLRQKLNDTRLYTCRALLIGSFVTPNVGLWMLVSAWNPGVLQI